MGNVTSTESDVIQLESVDVTGSLASAELVNSNVASSVDTVEIYPSSNHQDGAIESSVDSLQSNNRPIDPGSIWIKEDSWTILKTSAAAENLTNLDEALPPTVIEDLDIGVMDVDIVDASVIRATDTIDLSLDGHNSEPNLEPLNVDLTV